MSGGYISITKTSLQEFIFFPTDQQQPIIDLVKQCMTAKSLDKNADISHLQKQIDKLVYSLYGLTEDEIELVEGR